MNSIVSAAALATATAVAAPSITSAAPSADATETADPIIAAIEAHRCANTEYIKANEAPSRVVGKPRTARVCVGYYNDGTASLHEISEHGAFNITWTPTGKTSPLYAYDRAGIERNVPRDLQGHARDGWIAERQAELKKEKARIAKAHARTKLGKLEAIRDQAYERERDGMWDLIWTVPTTLNGLSALLRYCRENESINELVHLDEWEDVLEWTIESAVCAFAGLPKPPMGDVVASLWNEAYGDE